MAIEFLDKNYTFCIVCCKLHERDISVSYFNGKTIPDFPEAKARFPEISDTREFLLYGVPGTGKTLLSEWLAGETGYGLMKIDAGKLFSKWTGNTNKVRAPCMF